MPRLFYLLALLELLTPVAYALADSAPPQMAQHVAQTAHPRAEPNSPDATDTLNARSLAHAQQPKPVEPAKPVAMPILPDGTIASGTGVMAPELLEAPVYNPADRR
ncbi:hypothetical protein GOB86_00200 [Acetobacter lambici]|uniref:Uncharacterized protein n=1 Tax=Acetobacter lambici TaxID=1332824 RepID=A0ABT1EVN0_9PROT|nr:hypothetical protein [Acetobacter lambici]MCP1241316.1 hypothetical protein [Acetobacter lambici]MCP1257014.1 hypothetical protein [Acetobacter lambici]NHO55507.1 hypothetical protein [Acetobacter lambici]